MVAVEDLVFDNSQVVKQQEDGKERKAEAGQLTRMTWVGMHCVT
jgi:hypothetical protein